MLVDYHIHLDKIEWSMRSIEEMCKKAREAGIDRLGLVVHTKALKGFEPLYDHILSRGSEHKKLKFDKDINGYIDLLMSAKSRGYPIDIGIEVCYSPEGQEFLKEKLAEYPFDFKIGSVHLIGDKHYKTAVEEYKDRKAVGRLYYGLALKAIDSRIFNIIGHIEVARREGIPGLDFYPDLLEKICSSLVLNNCAVEINTKWLIKHGYLVPEKDTLEYMKQRGVKLVFGSDAHHMERIGFSMDLAKKSIMDAGYREFSMI